MKLQRLRDPDFMFGAPATADCGADVSVELGPGDLLYFPPGMWHTVEALPGDDSLSVNLSITGATWADTASNAVRHLLWRDDRWRRLVCASSLQPQRSDLLSNTHLATAPAMPNHSDVSADPVAASAAGQKRRRQSVSGPVEKHEGPLALLSGLPFHALTGCHLDPVVPARGAGRAAQGATGSILPRGVYHDAAGLLDSLRRCFAQLRPEHIVPPIALLSARFSDLGELNATWAIPRGFVVRLFTGGQSVITILSEECLGEGLLADWHLPRAPVTDAGGKSARRSATGSTAKAHPVDTPVAADSSSFTLSSSDLTVNPLALMYPAVAQAIPDAGASDAGATETTAEGPSELIAPDSDEDEASDAGTGIPAVPPGFSAWVVHVNCGAAPDMASQARCLIHVPTKQETRRVLGEPLHLDNAIQMISQLTASRGDCGSGFAQVRRSELRSRIQSGGGSGGSGRGSAACLAAEHALVAALAFVGVLSE